MLISALSSVQGEQNPLNLKSKRAVCVLLVDGLGAQNITSAGGHARFLNGQPFEKMSCYYPSTTSTSLTSLATGKSPNETGFVGYQVFDRSTNRSLNLLSGWESKEQAASMQTLETVSETAAKSQISFEVVSPAIYKDSGFTAATMREAEFHGVNEVSERFALASKLLVAGGKKVIYLYIPELDQIAHAFGAESIKWLNAVEELDGLIAKFVAKLPKEVGVLITADHGVIDVSKNEHIYIDEHFDMSLFDFVGGDTRGLFLYCKEDIETTKQQLAHHYSSSCYITSPEELIEAGYWSGTEKQSRYLPDLILLAKKNVALYHRGFAKQKSLNMIGHHGSISSAELSVPLFRFGF